MFYLGLCLHRLDVLWKCVCAVMKPEAASPGPLVAKEWRLIFFCSMPAIALQLTVGRLLTQHRPDVIWEMFQSLKCPPAPPGTLPHAPGKPALHPVMLQAAVSFPVAHARLLGWQMFV